MKFRLVDENGIEVAHSYEIRLPGWTEEQYLAEAPEQGFYEFKGGELIVHSPATIEHQEVVGFLTFLLDGYVTRNSSGKVFNGPAVLRIRKNLDREPDLFFDEMKDLGNIAEEYVEAPVSLVMEVVSESSRKRDLQEKAADYEKAGIAEYWAVHLTNKEAILHRLKEGAFEIQNTRQGRLESAAIPGYWMERDWLWRRPLPNKLDCLERLLHRDSLR